MEAKLDENLTTRAWDFHKDHEKVSKLLEIVFEKELESKGLSVKVIFEEFKSMLPFLRFIGIFSKNYKHTLDGFVVENENQEIIASVNIGYSLYHWEVAMVATHPDYRRRGLARRLINEAINHAKSHGAKMCVLEVLDINEPAYKLYRSIGFTHYDSITRQKIEFNNIPDIKKIDLPKDYDMIKAERSKKINQERYELDLRTTPQEVQLYHPVQRSKYFKPFLIRMIRPLAKAILKIKWNAWMVYKDEELVGYLSLLPSKKEGSPHRIDMMIDSEHSKNITEPMVTHILSFIKDNMELKQNVLIEFRTFETDQLESTRKYGFIDVETMHLLGLKLE